LRGTIRDSDKPPHSVKCETRIFYGLTPSTFQGGGVSLLIAGTAFFYILGHFPLVGVILTGCLFAYAKSIITSTAEGRKDPPDWPDFGDWKDDIVVPYLSNQHKFGWFGRLGG
jgi:hypothetical protein